MHNLIQQYDICFFTLFQANEKYAGKYLSVSTTYGGSDASERELRNKMGLIWKKILDLLLAYSCLLFAFILQHFQMEVTDKV